MRILTRYVLSELVKTFLIALGGLTAMMIVVGVIRELVMQNLPLAEVARLIPYILPDALRVAVPVTLLLATTYVYGRMSGMNEIVAAKALGISPMVLIWPSLAAAFLLSLATVWLNDLAVSWGRNGARRVVIEAVEQIAYGMLQAQKSYSSPHFSISVRRVEGRRLVLPTLTRPAQGSTPKITITAEEAELRADHDAKVLKIILRNGTLDVDGRMTVQFPDVYEQEIPLDDASRSGGLTANPSWLPMRDIPGHLAEQRRAVDVLEQQMAAEAAMQLLTGDFRRLASTHWTEQRDMLVHTRQQVSRLLTEPHRRWSAGFSCLCFAWVGVPMSIRLRNRDFLTSFFLCFLPILIVYYPLLAFGVDGAKSGNIPPYGVWVGNLLLLAWGAWLLRRVMRY
jgi:lipopolysaccharide export system permease protein